MKFLNSNAITLPVSKLVELSDVYIINGQVYDKNTMTPVSMQTVPIYSTKEVELSTYRTAYVNNYFGTSRVDKGFVIDTNDINICYKVTQNYNNANGYGATLAKIINNNGEYNIAYLSDNVFKDYHDMLDIISQDANYIYCYVYRNNGNANYLIVDKKTWKTKKYDTLVKTNYLNIINENDTYLYFYAYASNNSEVIHKLNKATLETKEIARIARSGNYIISCEIAVHDSINNKFYSVCDCCSDTSQNTSHYFIYKNNSLDIVNEKLTQSIINVDLDIYEEDKIILYPNTNDVYTHSKLFMYTASSGKKYITHFVINQGVDGNLNAKNSAMYTFEIIDENNWKLIDYKFFKPIVYKAILPIYENATIFAIHEYGCDTYSWDNATGKYEKINSMDETMTAVGIDMNNNIFIQKGDSSIEILSKTVPTTIFADFEEDQYEFQSGDIDTNVVIYAKNFENKFLNTTIELQLIGNVKFTDNGLKTKKVSTSNTGESRVPVTITGAGILQVRTRTI